MFPKKIDFKAVFYMPEKRQKNKGVFKSQPFNSVVIPLPRAVPLPISQI